MIHIRFVERADDQVQTLAEQHGYTLPDTVRNSEELKAAVPLSPAEEKLIKIIQKIVTENVADVAALHEELTNTPFERIEGYVLPLLYERTGEIEPSSLVQQNFSEAGVKGGGPFRTKRTEQGFVKSRSVGVKKVPRIDVFGIMEEAINAQEWYLHVQPVLLDAAELVFSKEYQAQAGRVNSNWWRDQIDIMARRGWKSGVQSTPLSRGMQLVRGNLNRAVLLFKASTVMMQQFAVIDALAYAKAKLGNETAGQIAKEFIKTRVSPAYVEELVKKSKSLQLRKGGEMAIEEVFTEAKRSDKWFARLEQVGGELVSRADMKVAAGVRQGILTVLEKNGLSGEAAAEEADFLMNISQSSADVAMRPHILGSSEGARTWFTFQNFFLNRWGLIAHDMLRGGAARGSFSERTNTLLGLAILMAGGLAENEARDLLSEFLGKKTTRNTNWIADLIAYIPEQVPFFGGMLENARRGFGTTEPPAIRALSGGVSGAVDVFRGKPVRGGLKIGESALTVYWGPPGTAQTFDFLEVMLEDVIAEEAKDARKKRR
jgi:hypothetical protein